MFTSKRRGGARLAHLRSRGALFENVIENRVYSPKRFSGYVGIWNAHAARLFHTHNQLQRAERHVLTSGKQREDACELPKHFVQDRRERFRRVAYAWECAMRRRAGFEMLARPDRLYRRE